MSRRLQFVFDHGPTTKVNDKQVMTLLLSLTYILADGGTHAATMIPLDEQNTHARSTSTAVIRN